MEFAQERRSAIHGTPPPRPEKRRTASDAAAAQSPKLGKHLTRVPVHAPGDRYELEADDAARAITSGGRTSPPPISQLPVRPAMETTVQADVGWMQGGGRALPPEQRKPFERGLGADLGHVRVHTGARAAATSRALGARAFTYGNHIAFNEGEFAPHTPTGHQVMGHELAHAVQQRSSTPVVQRLPLDYPLVVREASGLEFTLVGGGFQAGTTFIPQGSLLTLLVEGDPDSTVQYGGFPLQTTEVFSIANDRLSFASGGRSAPTPKPTNQEATLTPVVERAALAHGVPTAILKGLVFKESSWRPAAVSPTGPVGLMQMTKATAKSLGLKVQNPDERLDPAKQAPKGAKHLRELFDRFPEATNGLERWRFALAAYNQGPTGVNNAIRAWMSATGTTTWPAAGSLTWAAVAAHWNKTEGINYVRAILGESGAPTGHAATRYGFGQ